MKKVSKAGLIVVIIMGIGIIHPEFPGFDKLFYIIVGSSLFILCGD